jgi:hypothetical protein
VEVGIGAAHKGGQPASPSPTRVPIATPLFFVHPNPPQKQLSPLDSSALFNSTQFLLYLIIGIDRWLRFFIHRGVDLIFRFFLNK